MDINRGEIYLCRLPEEKDSSLQGGIRPCVIISNKIANRFSPILKIVPLTSKTKKLDLPCHVLIKQSSKNGLSVDSMALGEQTRAIDRKHILGKIGELDSEDMINVLYADLVQSGLAYPNNEETFKKIIGIAQSNKNIKEVFSSLC